MLVENRKLKKLYSYPISWISLCIDGIVFYIHNLACWRLIGRRGKKYNLTWGTLSDGNLSVMLCFIHGILWHSVNMFQLMCTCLASCSTRAFAYLYTCRLHTFNLCVYPRIIVGGLAVDSLFFVCAVFSRENNLFIKTCGAILLISPWVLYFLWERTALSCIPLGWIYKGKAFIIVCGKSILVVEISTFASNYRGTAKVFFALVWIPVLRVFIS